MSSTVSPNAQTQDVARGVLLETSNVDGETRIVLAIPNSDYRLHLMLNSTGRDLKVGRSLHGRIDVHAHRIDVSGAGGQFIDPVMGRPRTIQGRIRAIESDAKVLVIQAKVPIRAHLRSPQHTQDFEPGQLVRFNVDRGATFSIAD